MKLADVSIRRPVLATVMVGALLVFGLVAYPRIGVDLFPEVDFPVATITAVYPGADPETIETKVVDKLEEAVSAISGIKVLRSTSLENVGQVLIQFVLERKTEQAVQDVRDKVSAALRTLPPDLEPPVVSKFDIGAAPIMAVVVSGPQPARELTRVAEDVVKQRLQSIPGVGGIDVVGGRTREFHVYVDPSRLAARGLAVQDVVGALAAQNVEIPGGRLDAGARELVVKTRGQVHDARGLARIIIASVGGSTLRIGDVARVVDGEKEARSYAALDGRGAVSLVVRKQSGANTVQVAAAVRRALEGLRPRLPAGMALGLPLDNSTFIEKSIGDVKFDLAFGAALAVIIILIFLHDWRATLISALALPTSVIATFAFIEVMGFTFNNMTTLALSLSIGILIDDAIVVIEAIHRHASVYGKPPMRAASDACKEIGLAVMATTASIVAVFLPVAVMKGIIGRFFRQFGLTVAFAVTASLFVAFTLTPSLSARLLKRGHEGERRGALGLLIERVLSALDRAYRRLLGVALRRRAVTLLVAVATFAGSIALGRVVPVEFLPEEDRGEFTVKVDLPPGTSLSATRARVSDLTRLIRRVPGVRSTFTTVGGGATGEVNKAEVHVNLVPRAARAFTQEQAMAHMRALLGRRWRETAATGTFTVDRINAVGGGGFRSAMVQFNIRGSDFREINAAAEELTRFMRRQGGYVDIDTTYRGGKPEVRVNIDRARAADLGVPVAAIAATLRTLVAGQKATELPAAGDRFDVRVRLSRELRRSPSQLLALRVRSTRGQLVPLANLVTLTTGSGPARIERQARQRQVTLLANLEGKALGQATRELEAAARKLPAGVTTDWAGMAEVMQESVGHLGTALLLAVVMIYLILAAQFESFVHPLTIMVSLPLSLVGALAALASTGMTLNIFSMIGVIMLMGLVTKNAILLVDYANTVRREEGAAVREALLQAGLVRLRPILMTTGAMVAGMIPVALGQSEGGELRAPMAVCVIGGLITSTLLTLVVVPVVYSLFEGAAARLRGRRAAADEPA